MLANAKGGGRGSDERGGDASESLASHESRVSADGGNAHDAQHTVGPSPSHLQFSDCASLQRELWQMLGDEQGLLEPDHRLKHLHLTKI